LEVFKGRHHLLDLGVHWGWY